MKLSENYTMTHIDDVKCFENEHVLCIEKIEKCLAEVKNPFKIIAVTFTLDLAISFAYAHEYILSSVTILLR